MPRKLAAEKTGALSCSCGPSPGPQAGGIGFCGDQGHVPPERIQRPSVPADPGRPWREGGWRPPLGSCRRRPVGALRGLARVHVQGLQAVLAAHGTAPVELALALGHPRDAGRVVASAAAHDFAAVHAPGGQVAHAAGRAQGAWKDREASLGRWGCHGAASRRRVTESSDLQNSTLTPHSEGQPQGTSAAEGQVQEGWSRAQLRICPGTLTPASPLRPEINDRYLALD